MRNQRGKNVSESRTFDGKRYQVAIPWKEERPCLINNRPLAERRLQQVERKLVKYKKVAAAYQQTIDDYLQKNYIGRVPPRKKKCEDASGWCPIFLLFDQKDQPRRLESCLTPQLHIKDEVLLRRLYQAPSWKATSLTYCWGSGRSWWPALVTSAKCTIS